MHFVAAALQKGAAAFPTQEASAKHIQVPLPHVSGLTQAGAQALGSGTGAGFGAGLLFDSKIDFNILCSIIL